MGGFLPSTAMSEVCAKMEFGNVTRNTKLYF
ncbi:hypothetical protein CAURIC_03505 [Corynebacterium auriscanis]|nr:hypothetical protein CAURIC_03505 [Corynebacterium auriscanis]